MQDFFCIFLRSLPTRGGWIEIEEEYDDLYYGAVPPHAGRVD